MATHGACIDAMNKALVHVGTAFAVPPSKANPSPSPHVGTSPVCSTATGTAENVPFKYHMPQRTQVLKSRSEKEALRKRIYHQKIKDDRNALRHTVQELTLQLETLQRGKRTSTRGSVHSGWRFLAVKEREELRQAKAEQEQLLAAAERKALCIVELCNRVVGPGTNHLVRRPAPTRACTPLSPLPPLPPFDFTMFRGHLRRVHEGYTHTDTVLTFDTMAQGVVTLCKRRDSENEVEYFERRETLAVPFSYARTQHLVWALGKLLHRQENREDFGAIAGSDDLSVLRFRVLETLASGRTVSMIKRYVARRFVEASRTICVWKTHSEGEGIFCGMHSDETGWIRIRPRDDETEVVTCVRQVPLQFGVSQSPVDDFYALLQSAVHEDMTELATTLEKLLLEDTLADIDL